MQQPKPPEDTMPARTALAGTLARMRARVPNHLLVVGGLCLGIALLLTALDGHFGAKLIYSFCIGIACTAIVDLVRLGEAWISDRVRQARGMPPQDDHSGWRGALPGSLLAVLLGPAAGLKLADLITGFESQSLLDLGTSSSRLTIALSVLGTLVALVVISTMERLSAARAQAEAAQRQAAEHQLRLLQSQLEPHMIFNTLANLRVLIGLDPSRAQAMLDHLIHFLRATLNASRSATHSLATEFERIADYLALMGVRMGPRLQVRMDLPEDLRSQPVPPLLLQPLVENAIKHGLEPHLQGGLITVQARSEGSDLVLSVRDTGSGLAETMAPMPTGSPFGLAQVRERLATLHGARASLQLQPAADGKGGTLVTLRMPLTPTAGPSST